MRIQTGQGTIPDHANRHMVDIGNAWNALPGLVVSPNLREDFQNHRHSTELDIQMLSSLPSLLITLLSSCRAN